jgi:hypothetical protein
MVTAMSTTLHAQEALCRLARFMLAEGQTARPEASTLEFSLDIGQEPKAAVA